MKIEKEYNVQELVDVLEVVASWEKVKTNE